MVARSVNRVVAGAAMLLVASGLAQAEPIKPVRIGLVLSLSGPAAVYGIAERDAIQVVVNEINATGGIDNRPVELVVFDDKTNPTEATRGVTQMATTDKVLAVIGPGTGGGILAAGPVAERYKLPLLAPAGTVTITDKKNSFYPWIFRTMVSDYTSIGVLLERAVKDGAKRIAVVHQEDAFGKAGLEYAQKLASDIKFEIADSVSVPLNATDVSAQVLRLRNATPDAVFVQLSIPTLGAAFIKSMRQLKVDVPVYVGLGLAQRSFVDAVGSEGNGVRVASIGNLLYGPSATEKRLVDLLASAGKKPNGWPEIAGTTGLMAIVAGVRQVKGEPTPTSLRDALETLCGFEVYVEAQPCYSKDNHDGWGSNAITVTEIHDGQLRNLK